jgi:hypothetical protein
LIAFAFSALRWACAGLIDFSLGIVRRLGNSWELVVVLRLEKCLEDLMAGGSAALHRFCCDQPPHGRVETSVHQRIYLNCIEVDHFPVTPKLRGYFGSQRLGSKVVLLLISLSNYEYTLGRFKSIRKTTTLLWGRFTFSRFLEESPQQHHRQWKTPRSPRF